MRAYTHVRRVDQRTCNTAISFTIYSSARSTDRIGEHTGAQARCTECVYMKIGHNYTSVTGQSTLFPTLFVKRESSE